MSTNHQSSTLLRGTSSVFPCWYRNILQSMLCTTSNLPKMRRSHRRSWYRLRHLGANRFQRDIWFERQSPNRCSQRGKRCMTMNPGMLRKSQQRMASMLKLQRERKSQPGIWIEFQSPSRSIRRDIGCTNRLQINYRFRLYSLHTSSFPWASTSRLCTVQGFHWTNTHTLLGRPCKRIVRTL